MELASVKVLKNLFSEYKFRPSRQRGQNFLVDRKVLDKIIEASHLNVDDFVVEIGAGIGALTQELASRTKEVISVEIEPTLTKILADTVGRFKNLRLVKADALGPDFYQAFSDWREKFSVAQYKIVANIPYQITANFLRHYLPKAETVLMVLLVQKEVADRILAKPGDMSLLALSVQFYSQPLIIRTVSRNCFWPVPEVDSVILKLDPGSGYRNLRQISHDTEQKMFKLMRIGFSSKRKQLHNNLAIGFNLPSETVREAIAKVGLGPLIRAQELTLQNWEKLSESLPIV